MDTFNNLNKNLNIFKKSDLIHHKYLKTEILKYVENKNYDGLKNFIIEELIKFIKISTLRNNSHIIYFMKSKSSYNYIIFSSIIREELNLISFNILDDVFHIFNQTYIFGSFEKELQKYLEKNDNYYLD